MDAQLHVCFFAWSLCAGILVAPERSVLRTHVHKTQVVFQNASCVLERSVFQNASCVPERRFRTHTHVIEFLQLEDGRANNVQCVKNAKHLNMREARR